MVRQILARCRFNGITFFLIRFDRFLPTIDLIMVLTTFSNFTVVDFYDFFFSCSKMREKLN